MDLKPWKSPTTPTQSDLQRPTDCLHVLALDVLLCSNDWIPATNPQFNDQYDEII